MSSLDAFVDKKGILNITLPNGKLVRIEGQVFNRMGKHKLSYHRFPPSGDLKNIVGNTNKTTEENGFKALGLFSAPFSRIRNTPVDNNELEYVGGKFPLYPEGFPIRIIKIPEHNLIINVTLPFRLKGDLPHIFHQGVTIRYQHTDNSGNIIHRTLGIGNGSLSAFNNYVGPRYFNNLDKNFSATLLNHWGKKEIPQYLDHGELLTILGQDTRMINGKIYGYKTKLRKRKFIDPEEFETIHDPHRNLPYETLKEDEAGPDTSHKNKKFEENETEKVISPVKLQKGIESSKSFHENNVPSILKHKAIHGERLAQDHEPINPVQVASVGDIKGSEEDVRDALAPHQSTLPHVALNKNSVSLAESRQRVRLAKPRPKKNENMLKHLPKKGPERVKHDPDYNPFNKDGNGFEDLEGEVFVWKHQPERKDQLIRAAGRASFFDLDKVFEAG